jgi:hypothetical protein
MDRWMDRQLDTEMNRETESQTETKRQSLAPIPSPNSSPCRLSWYVLCILVQLPSSSNILKSSLYESPL